MSKGSVSRGLPKDPNLLHLHRLKAARADGNSPAVEPVMLGSVGMLYDENVYVFSPVESQIIPDNEKF